MTTINLKNFIHEREQALVGRENGRNVLEKISKQFDLEKAERNKIIIKIPKHINVINFAYFAGMFEEAVERLGKLDFLKQYEFEASDYIKSKIESYTDKACLNTTQNEILNYLYSIVNK